MRQLTILWHVKIKSCATTHFIIMAIQNYDPKLHTMSNKCCSLFELIFVMKGCQYQISKKQFKTHSILRCVLSCDFSFFCAPGEDTRGAQIACSYSTGWTMREDIKTLRVYLTIWKFDATHWFFASFGGFWTGFELTRGSFKMSCMIMSNTSIWNWYVLQAPWLAFVLCCC